VAEPFKTYQCGTCGFVYDEAEGLPEEGFPAGTRWADIPNDWVCPDCSMSKAQFEMVEL
jgi:rubredoxin